jgi:hypothetical protein
LAKYAVIHQTLHKPAEPTTNQPLLPNALRGRSDAPKVEARTKLETGRLELSVPLEGEHGLAEGRLNKERVKELATGLDSDDQAVTLDRITLRGEFVPDQSNYTVAVFKEGKPCRSKV